MAAYFVLAVLAVRGYQVFAFSCTTDAGKQTNKRKLFEAQQRARQLGDDQAAVALVSTVADPDAIILREAADDLHDQRLKVFGGHDLPDLKARLRTWITQQTGQP